VFARAEAKFVSGIRLDAFVTTASIPIVGYLSTSLQSTHWSLGLGIDALRIPYAASPGCARWATQQSQGAAPSRLRQLEVPAGRRGSLAAALSLLRLQARPEIAAARCAGLAMTPDLRVVALATNAASQF